MRFVTLTILFLTWLVCEPVTCQDIVPAARVIWPVVPVLVEPDTPVVRDPQPITTLKADEFLVVESNVELFVRQFPEGLIAVESSAGPIKVRAKFSDGSGKTETRTYRCEFVYFLTAVTSGTAGVDLIPVGVLQQESIIRHVLTVDGTLPNPPPGPGPTPDPKPPQPVTSFRVIFVKESGDTLNPQQTAIPAAKAIRDYLIAKTTPEGGVAGWREYDPQQTTANEQATMRALWEAVKVKLLPAPCLVIEVNGHATVMPFPATVDEAIQTLKKYGG